MLSFERNALHSILSLVLFWNLGHQQMSCHDENGPKFGMDTNNYHSMAQRQNFYVHRIGTLQGNTETDFLINI